MTEFEAVYRAYFQDVELYLLALCKDKDLAEELAAQTFFKALEALPKFRGESDIRSWLCAIGKNCYLTHLRKERPAEDIDAVQIPDTDISVEEKLMNREQAMEIHKVLHNLPEPYREVFSLRVFGQLPFTAIGELFGKSQNWACVTFHRAKQKIKDALEVSK